MAIVIKVELGRVHLGKAGWVGNTDGDTPTVELDIRMLGIDTPELHYPGTTRPRTYDAKLRKLLQTHGPHFSPGLREHLAPRLEGTPGSAQEAWGEQARVTLGELAEEDLTVMNPRTGRTSRRKSIYEYRFCVDTLLGKRRGPDKYCVDITTGLIHQP